MDKSRIRFRDLKTHEVECRISQVKENYITLLIYKNARVDMDILDETVGAENWTREHYECKGNLFCRVAINVNYMSDSIPVWVAKSDCGSESRTEKEKGESSDSFKRACFCWGIGRELYTAPNIYITDCKIEDSGRKDSYGQPVLTCRDYFRVLDMKVENKRIVALTIGRYDKQRKQWVTVYDKRAVQRQ